MQRPAVLACAKGFEGMRELDSLVEISKCFLAIFVASSVSLTYWHSLSTRSAKLSAPSILGTPASSAGHLDMDSCDIIRLYRKCIRGTHVKSRAQKPQTRGAMSSRLWSAGWKWQSPKRHSFSALMVAPTLSHLTCFLHPTTDTASVIELPGSGMLWLITTDCYHLTHRLWRRYPIFVEIDCVSLHFFESSTTMACLSGQPVSDAAHS
jgi:hypothetical protein